ncbi:MAG: YfhO family protein [Acidimicrobiales bacterium]
MRLDTTGAETVPEGGLSETIGAADQSVQAGQCVQATQAGQCVQVEPATVAAPPPTTLAPARRRTQPTKLVAFAVVAAAVLVFSWGWPGRLVLDGPGVALWLRLAVEHLQHGGGVPYWMPEMWAGSPAWALAPSFPTLILVPFGLLVGAEQTIKLATIAAQIVGGWGAFVLAHSLWRDRPGDSGTEPSGNRLLLPAAAALIYALHPLVVSHAALFGHETSLWVIAVTPWLAWTIRQAFQSTARRWAVASGLLSAFAVLHQAEHAYGLVLMGGCQLALELARARHRPGAVRHILTQTAVIGGVTLGMVAFWLLPFLSLHRSFVLTPPEIVRSVLEDGLAAELGNEPGTFLSRAASINRPIGFEGDLLSGNVYLSWVCLIPTFLTALLISRHDDDGHLTAILVAGSVGVWLSTAGTPLADSGPAQRFELLPFLVIGTLMGLLAGSCLRRITSGRAAAVLGIGATAALLIAPYVTPFLELQRVIPLLDSVRFPRLYPVAALGVALGAVYPIRVGAAWLRSHRPHWARRATIGAVVVLLVAFLVDIVPYRSFYRARPPDGEAAYQQAAATLASVGTDFRVAVPLFGDPRLSRSLVENGIELSVGWPHPIAAHDAWRLTGEPMISPPFYREQALGLAATAYIASEQFDESDHDRRTVTGVNLQRNPWALPLVRAYRHAVVVRDSSIAPELAVSLAQHNVAVVAGGGRQVEALAELGPEVVGARDACAPELHGSGAVANEVSMACALHNWVGMFAGYDVQGVGDDLGAVFRSSADGLRGVSVWLDRPPGATELVLYAIGPDGFLGPAVASARSSATDWDDNGLYAFRFDPLPDSAGQRYAFILSCGKCLPTDEPRLVSTHEPRMHGTLTRANSLVTDRGAAYSLLYEDTPDAEPADTTLRATEMRPGHWRVSTSGSHAALVVVAEAWFPGWRATVDGRPAPVLEADGAFLGVPVGAGDHTIEITFHPPPLRALGRLITAGTVVALVLGAFLSRRRRTKPAAT